MEKSGKFVSYALILLIIIGIFLRFQGLKDEYLWDDEHLSMISAIKIHSQDFKSGVLYFQEHPGLGKWLVALPVNFISANYVPIGALGPNMFAWSFLAYEALAKNYVAIRIMNAILGTLAITFTFLIVRKLFNREAALWSAAIMSLSPDMIAYSRHEVLMKGIAISLALGAIYFYIIYLKEKIEDKKWLYLAATILLITFTLGSRNFDPLFIIPTIIISQFLINRGKEKLKENLIVTALIILSFIFVFFYTYPPEAKAFAQERLEAQSPLQLIGFTFPSMIYLVLTRNSYLTAVTFILIIISIFYYINKRNQPDEKTGLVNLWQFLKEKETIVILPIFLSVTFLGIGFSRLGTGFMYNIMFYASLFLLSGIFTAKIIKKYDILKYVFLLILIINLIQIIPNFPYSTWDYSNFNLGDDFYQNKFDKTVPDAILKELELRGNPIISTSITNALIFYKGEKLPIVIPNEARCNEDYFRSLLVAKPLIIHKTDIAQDQFVCQLYKAIQLKEIKNFEGKAFLYEIEEQNEE